MRPDEDCVDLREAKKVAGQLLARGDPLREAFLREPDFLTLAEAGVKLPIYLRMCLSGSGAAGTA